MRPSRDTWLAIGLIALLAVLTVVAGLQQIQQTEAPPLASWSTLPDGTQALWRWLESLDYAVSREVGPAFVPPPQADVILMLEPGEPISNGDWRQLEAWMSDGGTLVLAGDRLRAILAFQRLGFEVRFEEAVGPVAPATPLLRRPPLNQPAPAGVRLLLDGGEADVVPLLAVPGGMIAGARPWGDGWLIVSTAVYPFTNAGLKEAGNPELVLNLVTAHAEPAVIWFDEWHHGRRAEELVGPGSWLRRTPAGRALLYAAVVVFAGLALQGRGFGRPLPLAEDTRRRSPLEYVTAVANLNRRAGHRTAVLQQYRRRLKRGLGRRYRLSPGLDDGEFVARLATYNPRLDAAALLSLLNRLNQSSVSESELIQLAAEAAAWLDDERPPS